RPARVCEVASRARSTGGAESTDSWRDVSPEPESLAVHDTMTSFAFTKVLRAGAVIESEGAFGSKWKGMVASTEFPARSVAVTWTAWSPACSDRSVSPSAVWKTIGVAPSRLTVTLATPDEASWAIQWSTLRFVHDPGVGVAMKSCGAWESTVVCAFSPPRASRPYFVWTATVVKP